MGNPDIGGTPGQIGGPSGPFSVDGVSEDVVVPKKVGFSDKDSLSAADLQVALMLWNVNNPVLDAPSTNKINSVDLLLLDAGKKYQEVCRSILDNWSESLKKIADDQRKDANSPDAIAKLDEDRRKKLGLVSNVQSYINQVDPENSTNAAMLAFIASSLVVSGVSLSVVDVVSTGQFGITPQIDALNTLWTQSAVMIPSDLRAELGLIGTLMMSGTLYAANVDQVGGKAAGQPIDENALATNYANRMLRLTKSDQLEDFVKATLGDKYTASASAMVKTVMLCSALAALYKSETKWITGQEFRDLVNGKMEPKSKEESDLMAALRTQLASMPDKDQEMVLSALASYMDSNPKFDSFFDVGKMFDAVTTNITPPIGKG